MEAQKQVPVVAAMIVREDGRLLLCQRSAVMKRPLRWEFPGGKVEAGETGAEALRRECSEELDVLLDVAESVSEVTFSYPDISIRLTLYRARIQSGALKAKEHAELRWLRPSEVAGYALCPADQLLWEQLTQEPQH